MLRGSLLVLAFFLNQGSSVTASFASETDQYTYREVPLRDAGPIVDARVNDAIQEIVAGWKPKWGPNRARFVRKLRRKADGRYMFNRLSLWLLKQDVDFAGMDPKTQSHPVRDDSIYAAATVFQATAQVVYGLAPTVQVGGVRMGTDKLSHFMGGGGALYRRRFVQGMSLEKFFAVNRAEESGLYGQTTTGTFSNADLVANYEGFLAMLDLFDISPWTGKDPVVRWDETVQNWTIQRPFTIEDYANPYWDEALNPSDYTCSLRPVVEANLAKLCAKTTVETQLGLYSLSPEIDAILGKKYESLGLIPHPELRLDRFCAERAAADTSGAGTSTTGDTVSADASR